MIVLLGLAAAAFLAACSGGMTRADLEKKYGDWIEVTYDIGEGTWRGRDNVDVSYRYAPKEGGVYVMEPGKGELADSADPRRTGYFLEGWYADADFTDRWDFATDKTTTDCTIYARWLPNFRFTFYYVEDGREIEISSREVGEGETLPRTATPTRSGYTFLEQCYSDPELKTPWDYSTPHIGKVVNGVQTDLEMRVYTDWIEGEYKLVRNGDDLLSMTSGNIYLMDNIDFAETLEGSDVRRYTWIGDTFGFSGIFRGNGHTIKNIELAFPTMVTGRATEYGLFGSLKSGAQLIDVTFENVKITVNDTAGWRRSLGLLAGIVEEGVTFRNVAVSGELILEKLYEDPEYYQLGLIAGELDSDTTGLDCTGIRLVTDNLTTHTARLEADKNTITLTRK